MNRDEIDGLIAAGRAADAAGALKGLFHADPRASTAAFVASRFEKIAPRLSLTPLRVAVLRSFTIEPLVPLLLARGYIAGLDLRVMVGDHNVIAQQALDPASAL